MLIVSLHSRRGRRPGVASALALGAALAVLAGGCGTHLVRVNSSVVRLRIDEYSLTPQDVVVHAGRLKIIAVNTGILTHNVRVEVEHPSSAGNPFVPGCVPPGTAIGCGTGVAQPGQRVVSPKLQLDPGHYRLVDTIANHADLGDYGTLTVVP